MFRDSYWGIPLVPWLWAEALNFDPQAQVGLAGSNNGSDLHIARNLFTYEDGVTLTRGNASSSVSAYGFSNFSRTKRLR